MGRARIAPSATFVPPPLVPRMRTPETPAFEPLIALTSPRIPRVFSVLVGWRQDLPLRHAAGLVD